MYFVAQEMNKNFRSWKLDKINMKERKILLQTKEMLLSNGLSLSVSPSLSFRKSEVMIMDDLETFILQNI